MVPNRKASFKSQLPGAILSAVSWYVFSFGLSIYVEYFNGFSTYGSLATIVLVMLWLYFCMYIPLLCAETNVVFSDLFHKWRAKNCMKSEWELRNNRKHKKERDKKSLAVFSGLC